MQLAVYAKQSPAFLAFTQAVQQIEQSLRRPINTQEAAALADTWPNLSAVLALIGQGQGQEQMGEAARGNQFAISTALASLQSLSQILDEEPDLPKEQRRQFITAVKQQAAVLTENLDSTHLDPDLQGPPLQSRLRPCALSDLWIRFLPPRPIILRN